MDLNLASNWPWLAGGAAAIAAGWGFIKSALDWLSTLFVGQIKCDSSTSPIKWFIWNKCTKLISGRLSTYWESFNKDGSTRESIAYEQIDKEPIIVFYGWVPLMVSQDGSLIIRYIRGIVNPEKLLREIQQIYTNRPVNGRFRINYVHGYANTFNKNEPLSTGSNTDKSGAPTATSHSGVEIYTAYRPVTHTVAELLSSVGVSSIDELSYDDEVLEAVKEIEQWLKLKNWYKQRGIPWRRGWLLTGKPGTGKSTLVKSLAKTMDMPVVYFDLSTFLNTCFMEAWKEQSTNAPFIALFEDIDAVFNKRENMNKTITGGLTFDCFLNAIAGADTTDGVFTVITTNDVTKIDPALAVFDERGGTSRPGRIDRIIDLGNMSSASRLKTAKRILKDVQGVDLADIVKNSDGFTAAQFTELCVRKALKEKWNK